MRTPNGNGAVGSPTICESIPLHGAPWSPALFPGFPGHISDLTPDLFFGAHDAILVLDGTGKVLDGNPAAERLFGRDRQRLVGVDATDVLSCPELPRRLAHGGAEQDTGGKDLLTGWSCHTSCAGDSQIAVECILTPALRTDPPTFLLYVRDASALQKAEQAARESEQWFHITFDAAPIGLAIVSTDGHFLRVNETGCRILGYAGEDLLGRTYREITHPEDLDADAARMQRLLSGEAVTEEWEKRSIRKDGSVVWVLLTVSLVRDQGGRPLYFIGQIQDITERKRAQAEVEESERKFRKLAENARDIVYRIRLVPSMQIEYMSAAVASISGYRPEEFYADPSLLFRIAHPEDRAQMEKHLSDPEDNPVPPLMRWFHRDGHVVWTEQRRTALLDEEGRMVAVEGIAREVSVRVRALQALEESQARLQAIFDNTHDAMMLVDDDFRFVDINPGTCQILGCPREELIGASLWDFTPAELLEDGKRRWREFLEKGRTSGEFRLARPDGEAVVIEYRGVTNILPGLHLSIYRDVTERKRAEEATQWLAAIVESSSDAIMGIDLDGRITSWNATAERLYGYTADEMIGKPFTRIVPPEEMEDFQRIFQAVANGHRTEYAEMTRLRHDGTRCHVSSMISPVLNGEGRVVGVSAIARDITERKYGEAILQRYRLLAESTTDLIFFTDADGTIVDANEAAVRVFGYTRPELLGMTILQLRAPEAGQHLFNAAAREHPVTYETVARRKDGETFPIEVNLHGIEIDDQMLFVGVARDISERKAYEEQLSHHAFHDRLTELPNRALFMNRLEHALNRSRRRKDRVAVLFLDLDRFKMVNDSKGHMAGDQLLIAVAGRLRCCLRLDDTIARLGGDEFTVLIENVEDDGGGATRLAERILRKLQAPFQVMDQEVFISASIGIAFSAPGETSAEEILRKADLAMYQAKARGKARYSIYQPHLGSEAEEQLRFETELRRAIERDQFHVFFQPIVLMETGRAIGVEALVRWNHPRFGLMPPDEFVPLQEQIGLIEPFTMWILEQAMTECLKWHAAGHHITVSVNLSPHNLHAPQFANRVMELLARTGLPASYLKLEITEGAVMMDPAQALEVLQQLSDMGVRLSVDDFGTGYSSLSYLKQLPVHEIKIDKSFVIGMDGKDDDDAAIVRATIDLAHNLRKRVVAEGVESDDVWNLLNLLGCDAAQGYHMARPMPADEVLDWLTTSAWGTAAPGSIG